MAAFQIGSFLFIGSIEDAFQVSNVTEKAIQVKRQNQTKWVPISGLLIQKRNPLLHESTPDTYKLAKWVKW